MRYTECQDYFNIYVDNPKQCKMVILTNKDVKTSIETLSARALLWNTDKGFYLDRIYYTEPYEVELIKLWVKEKYNNDIFYPTINKLSISLDNKVNPPFPYLDSMCYLNTLNNTLTNYVPSVKKEEIKCIYYLQDTEGGYESEEDYDNSDNWL